MAERDGPSGRASRRRGGSHGTRTLQRARRSRRNRVAWPRVALVAALLLAALAAAGTAYVWSAVAALPPVTAFESGVARTSYIYDAGGRRVTPVPGAPERVTLQSLDQVPAAVRNAFVAVEDRRFYSNPGVDLRGILRAAWANLRGGRAAQGGSTIAQQLARSAFPIGAAKTLRRKIQEAALAIEIERHYTKTEVLRHYLDDLYFGRGAVGIGTAARTYFGVDVQRLNLAQGALLAGLVQAPATYDPLRHPAAALRRRGVVLQQMRLQHYISAAQAREAEALPLSGVAGRPLAVERAAASATDAYPYPFFVDYVLSQLKRHFTDRQIWSGGLHVYTTLRPSVQRAAQDALRRVLDRPFPLSARPHLEAAVVVLDQRTGAIAALVGGREHTAVLQADRAVSAERQPGSALKPLAVYVPALEAGLTPASVVDDALAGYPGPGGRLWVPRNHDGFYGGLTTLAEAVRRSVNVVAVKVLARVGVDRGLAAAERMGATDLGPADASLALALGGTADCCTPLEMARAYATIADGGVRTRPVAILRVLDSSGRLLFSGRADRRLESHLRARVPNVGRVVMEVEPQPADGWIEDRSTAGRAAVPGWPTAGKTGTTSGSRDAWFVGFTPRYTAAVWLGDDRPRTVLGLSGGGYAADIFRDTMVGALAGLAPAGFAVPPGIVTEAIDAKSGMLPGPLTPQRWIRREVFVRGTQPTRLSDAWERVAVVRVGAPPAGAGAPAAGEGTPPAGEGATAAGAARTWARWDPGCPLPPEERVFLARPPVTPRQVAPLARAAGVPAAAAVPRDMALAAPAETCTQALGAGAAAHGAASAGRGAGRAPVGPPPAGSAGSGPPAALEPPPAVPAEPSAGSPAQGASRAGAGAGGPGAHEGGTGRSPGLPNPVVGSDGVTTWSVTLPARGPMSPPVVSARTGEAIRIVFGSAGPPRLITIAAPGCTVRLRVPARRRALAECRPARAGTYPVVEAPGEPAIGALQVAP